MLMLLLLVLLLTVVLMLYNVVLPVLLFDRGVVDCNVASVIVDCSFDVDSCC